MDFNFVAANEIRNGSEVTCCYDLAVIINVAILLNKPVTGNSSNINCLEQRSCVSKHSRTERVANEG